MATPCKDCIAYSICNSYISDIKPPFEYFHVREQLLSIYSNKLQNRCSLIKDYIITIWVTKGDISLNKVIIKVLNEGFSTKLDEKTDILRTLSLEQTKEND